MSLGSMSVSPITSRFRAACAETDPTADMTSAVGGSNIGAASAATLHQQWVTELGGQYLIGSPAVARGSKKWMDDWVAACAGNCVHDFVPFHFYGTDVEQLIQYVEVSIDMSL